MEVLRQFFYRPYMGRSSPRHACYAFSRQTNPVDENFDCHVAVTRREVSALFYRRRWGMNGYTNSSYNSRPWFQRMLGMLDALIDKVKEYRSTELNSQEVKRLAVLLGALEIVCSLILFNNDDNFKELSDEDIESLRFPLSRWSRLIIQEVKIIGDDLKVASLLL